VERLVAWLELYKTLTMMMIEQQNSFGGKILVEIEDWRWFHGVNGSSSGWWSEFWSVVVVCCWVDGCVGLVLVFPYQFCKI
jgi:hypothetical protein